jgi:hypothetical protein
LENEKSNSKFTILKLYSVTFYDYGSDRLKNHVRQRGATEGMRNPSYMF